MQSQTQKALVVQTLGSVPVFTDFEIPQPGPNEVLIKVIASTINPSDRFRVKGAYGATKVPFVAGLEGCGQIVKTGNHQHQKLIGKRVSFQTLKGAWAQYTVTSFTNVWEIDSDVPLECAASGIVNPLTVIGIVDTYQKWEQFGEKGKGLINTAAASALGRMLNKYCQRQGVALLNVVRRKEQAKILEEEGAKFILDTSNQNWIDHYKQFLNTHGFNVLFDAIGGGEVTETLISNLKPGSQVFVYGKLSTEPFIMRKPIVGLQGTSISNFMLFEWYGRISAQEKQKIQEHYSSFLKNELATYSIKQVDLENVPSIWEEAEKRATEGKFTIKI